MISARRRSDTRRLLLIGLFVSLIVHLFGGSLYDVLARVFARITPPPRFASLQEPPARSQTITIEKAVPTPVPVVKAVAPPHRAAPPQPVVIQAPNPAPAPMHHELAHNAAHAPPQPPPVRGPATAAVPRVVTPGAPKTRHPYYSDDQMAQMNAAFSQTIADSHETLAAANAAMARPVQTVKHYEMHFAGIHEGMNPGDGIIRPTKHWRGADGQNYYYVHYEYMYGDGRVEEGDVPWPVHYPPNQDPFARGDKRIPIQDPPPDYHPDHELQPILQAFFGGPNPFAQEDKGQ
jgi:hypothetical protein